MEDNLEANKKSAIAFCRSAYLGDPAKAVEMCLAAVGIRPNPGSTHTLSKPLIESLAPTAMLSVNPDRCFAIHSSEL